MSKSKCISNILEYNTYIDIGSPCLKVVIVAVAGFPPCQDRFCTKMGNFWGDPQKKTKNLSLMLLLLAEEWRAL